MFHSSEFHFHFKKIQFFQFKKFHFYVKSNHARLKFFLFFFRKWRSRNEWFWKKPQICLCTNDFLKCVMKKLLNRRRRQNIQHLQWDHQLHQCQLHYLREFRTIMTTTTIQVFFIYSNTSANVISYNVISHNVIFFFFKFP